MGAAFRWNAGMADGFFEHSRENLLTIVRYVRACRPRIVLANALSDRHPDHGRAAKLIADACFLSGLRRIETTDINGTPQQHHRPDHVFHYIQDHQLEPDFLVDITGYFDRKMEAVLAYSSQFHNPDEEKQQDNEPQTPISGRQFFDYLRARAMTYGRQAGFDLAEGFQTSRVVGVDSLFDLY